MTIFMELILLFILSGGFLTIGYLIRQNQYVYSNSDKDDDFIKMTDILESVLLETFMFEYQAGVKDSGNFGAYLRNYLDDVDNRNRINVAAIFNILEDNEFIQRYKKINDYWIITKKRKNKMREFIANWNEKYMNSLYTDYEIISGLIENSVNNEALNLNGFKNLKRIKIDELDMKFQLMIMGRIRDKYNIKSHYNDIYNTQ